MDRADRRRQRLVMDGLHEIAAGTGHHRHPDVLGGLRGGEHDDTGSGKFPYQAPQRVDAVHPLHADIEEHDVGGVLTVEIDRREPVLGLGDHRKSMAQREHA